MKRSIAASTAIVIAVVVLACGGYHLWQKRRIAASSHAILPANHLPNIPGAGTPAHTPGTPGQFSSQPMSAGQLPNRNPTEDVQRTLRTIDDVNRINKLNREQNQRK